jgi:hypothetical protein
VTPEYGVQTPAEPQSEAEAVCPCGGAVLLRYRGCYRANGVQGSEFGLLALARRGGLQGRGRFKCSRHKTKRLAHRAVWESLRRRPITAGALLLHKCDVSCCVNPDHLYEGTHLQNMADMSNRCRATRWNANLPRGVRLSARHRSKPWEAYLYLRGKRLYLGMYASKEEAAAAYVTARLAHGLR